jgi:4'-phosphopantetheinyl transferase
MWYALSCKCSNHSKNENNRIIWFMNSNNALKQNVVWHKQTNTGLAIATHTDDGTLATSELWAFLSSQEKEKASALQDPIEHRHYVSRRCFQRLFVSELLSNTIAPDKLALIHQRDSRPQCDDAPELNLTFSSSGPTAIACASFQNAIGVDIERLRTIENLAALAQRYFTSAEADVLANLVKSEQNKAFFHYWTAKEAGLKAIGQGIVFGLNTFCIRDGGASKYEILGPENRSQNWRLDYFEFVPNHLIAVVGMNSVGKT